VVVPLVLPHMEPHRRPLNRLVGFIIVTTRIKQPLPCHLSLFTPEHNLQILRTSLHIYLTTYNILTARR